ncbi:MAG: hypothetical protein ACI9CF_001323 [Candidatus Omnitrophota bacterium]|jgi:hypothetical protein
MGFSRHLPCTAQFNFIRLIVVFQKQKTRHFQTRNIFVYTIVIEYTLNR